MLLTDSRYLEQAEREVPELPLRHAEGDYLAEIAAAVKVKGIRRLAFASWRMSHCVVGWLGVVAGVDLIATEDPILRMRSVKDQEEIEFIRRATRISEEALTQLVAEITAGVNEVDVAFQFGVLMRVLGSERVSFEVTVASGEKTLLPYYRPSLGRRTLGEGDFWAQVSGYCSDMTRTFVVGEASEKQREIYDCVRRSTDAGLDALRAGVFGSEVHWAAGEVIEGSPYKEYIFLSPVGHGVGLEVHELPKLGPDKPEVLESGMAVTMEPGIYIFGLGEVRIEDIALITEDGYELLTNYPRDQLIEIG